MNSKEVVGSLAIGALLMAGMIGIISLWRAVKNDGDAPSIDEINDMPIGI